MASNKAFYPRFKDIGPQSGDTKVQKFRRNGPHIIALCMSCNNDLRPRNHAPKAFGAEEVGRRASVPEAIATMTRPGVDMQRVNDLRREEPAEPSHLNAAKASPPTPNQQEAAQQTANGTPGITTSGDANLTTPTAVSAVPQIGQDVHEVAAAKEQCADEKMELEQQAVQQEYARRLKHAGMRRDEQLSMIKLRHRFAIAAGGLATEAGGEADKGKKRTREEVGSEAEAPALKQRVSASDS